MSESYSRPATGGPLGSARECHTTDRGYPSWD